MAAVFLELQNMEQAVARRRIWYDSGWQFTWEVRDQTGKFVKETPNACSIQTSLPYWIVLPRDSTLRFRVSVGGWGIKTGGGTALQFENAFWQLPNGTSAHFTLRATFSVRAPQSKEQGRDRAMWQGSLVIPPVAL
jgi:hypothetical protein